MEEGLQRISDAISQPNTAEIIVNILTAIGTIAAAIFAAVSASAARSSARASQQANEMQVKQIKLQNKQSLFNIRSKNYTTVSRLMERYPKFSSLLDSSINIDGDYNTIRKNARKILLCAIGFEFSRDNDNSWSFDDDEKILKITHILIDKIETTITEISLLYDDIMEDAIDFLECYRILVLELYNYEINIQKLRKQKDTTWEIFGNYGSLEKANKGLKNSYKNLIDKNTLSEMEKIIKI